MMALDAETLRYLYIGSMVVGFALSFVGYRLLVRDIKRGSATAASQLPQIAVMLSGGWLATAGVAAWRLDLSLPYALLLLVAEIAFVGVCALVYFVRDRTNGV